MSETINLTSLLETLETTEIELKRFVIRCQQYYREFESEKKSGGKRTIVAPTSELKQLQRKINQKILKEQELPDTCTGYRKGYSIVTNAMPHVGQRFVLNLDLKDFFPSISMKRVLGLFQSLGYERSVAMLLTRATTYKGALPQGAPTSPHIANLICRGLDGRLEGFCKARGWQYTRYCDDITISGDKSPGKALETICGIIESEGFIVNQEKTRVKYNHQQQSVTGVVVNEKVHLPRKQRRVIRSMCHHMKVQPESFRGVSDSVLGQLHYANMVEGLLEKSEYREALELLLENRRLAKLTGAIY